RLQRKATLRSIPAVVHPDGRRVEPQQLAHRDAGRCLDQRWRAVGTNDRATGLVVASDDTPNVEGHQISRRTPKVTWNRRGTSTTLSVRRAQTTGPTGMLLHNI